MLGIPYVTRIVVFGDDFMVRMDLFFVDDFKIKRNIVFTEDSMRLP